MHGHNETEFLQNISGFIGSYYLFIGMMNAVAALYLWRTNRAAVLRRIGQVAVTSSHLWLAVAMFFVIVSAIAFGGGVKMLGFSQATRDFFDSIMAPEYYVSGVLILLLVLYAGRRFFVKPAVAWGMLNLALVAMGFSMTDPDFADIVTKPDNVPIVGLVYLLGYFTWLGAYQAVQNDDRIAEGLEPLEKQDS